MRARTHIEALAKSDTPITHRGPRSLGSIHLNQPYRTQWLQKLKFRCATVFMRVRTPSAILGFACVAVPMRVCIRQAVKSQQPAVSGQRPLLLALRFSETAILASGVRLAQAPCDLQLKSGSVDLRGATS